MVEIKRREMMWAEMKPDMYGGETCDEIVPRWSCYSDGDKEGEDNISHLDFAAKTFAPGTRVVVLEPCCPSCGIPRWPDNIGGEVTFPSKCDCGFDWDAWVSGAYS